MDLLSDFDYLLPERLIAQAPLEKRSDSKLLVLGRESIAPTHRQFSDVLDYLNPGDALVINTSKVMKARLHGHKRSGGRVEILLSRPITEKTWICLVKAKGPKENLEVVLRDSIAVVKGVAEDDPGAFVVEFEGDIAQIIEKDGELPLPGYIERPSTNDDALRYQTVYADDAAKLSVAAPTAGLHFDEQLLQKIKDKGVIVVPVILHVGPGTFAPVRDQDISLHQMHGEMFQITKDAASAINEVKANGGRVIAVGTTSVRTLESASQSGRVEAGSHLTRIFIRPGFKFQIVDALITNFHLPKTTLLMLVSALVGRERILSAYDEAIKNQYRFFSYGDACYFERMDAQ